MNMKTCGIITEYNPFHQGHIYHIKKAKELTGSLTPLFTTDLKHSA